MRYHWRGVYRLGKKIVCEKLKEARGNIICVKSTHLPFPSFYKHFFLSYLVSQHVGDVVFTRRKPTVICIKKRALARWCHGQKED